MFTFSSICMHSSHMNCSSSSTARRGKSQLEILLLSLPFNFYLILFFILIPCDVRSLVTLFSPALALSPVRVHSFFHLSVFCLLFFSTLLHECCSCRTTASDVHLARVYINLCVGVYMREKEKVKEWRIKKHKQHTAQQRINVITIKDHHSRSSSSFSERRDNFWTLFQAWLIHMFCFKKWMEEDEEKKKTRRNVCSLVVYSEYKCLLRLLDVGWRWIFRHLASQWNKICVKSLSLNKWFAPSVSLFYSAFTCDGLGLHHHHCHYHRYLHNILTFPFESKTWSDCQSAIVSIYFWIDQKMKVYLFIENEQQKPQRHNGKLSKFQEN